MANKSYLDYAGLKRVLKRLLPGNRKIWHGSWEDWELLSAAEKAEYDQAELTLGSFEQENTHIDTVVADTENMVSSNAVNAKYNDIGAAYVSGDFTNSNSPSWQNNIPVNIANVKKGKYLIIGEVNSNCIGIISINGTSSTGTIRVIGAVSITSYTGDNYYMDEPIAFYEQPADGAANFTVNLYYSAGSFSANNAIGRIRLLKIA